MRIKKKKRHRRPVSVEASSESIKITSVEDEIEPEPEPEQENLKIDGEGATPVMSEEELNKRVEAFIAMFRQHLASDARTSRNQFLSNEKQTVTFKLQKESSMAPEVRCVV
ncbi:hypothetical protein HS088_TW12G00858 [Tripterygium wilfordii]|uniref:Uncharacterized protein n=1 Tax=Tripterygium wilfordii TaxID=458696 RepID=A0A7J7D085_TRIWF|nr:uncharacterized protein LOC120010640 [Tripterygium wilfordii]KAF5739649.1 hypothetical protein HS088_TW12G00858 [Tripterygium wilfordii]